MKSEHRCVCLCAELSLSLAIGLYIQCVYIAIYTPELSCAIPELLHIYIYKYMR